MKTVKVNASKCYDVIIGHGVREILSQKIREMFPSSKVMIVTDSRVASLHLEKIQKILNEEGIENLSFVFPDGEKSKNPSILFELLEALAENRFTKSDVLLALGGGVTGDLTGLAGALYMRGMNFISMPTTLLSAVDSSVGGKTAVNLNAGKNLAGVFNQPQLVLCDTKLLETLDDKDFADGMAEVIKYGVLADEELFSLVKEGQTKAGLEEIIARCVEIKRDIVNEDEFDTGRRQLLNFGHTFAHAIEAESGFAVSHGTAVAMGMVLASELAYKNGLTDCNLSEEIRKACEKNSLKTECPYNFERLFTFVKNDKKISGGNITFIVPERIGRCVRVTLSLDAFTGMQG